MKNPEQAERASRKVVDQLLDMIREGHLQPGDRLPAENTLAKRLGVSRPTLREALTVLEVMGLVEVKPRQGNVVSALLPQTTRDPILDFIGADPLKALELFEVRRAIDSEGLAMAVERATDEELAEIGRMGADLEKKLWEKGNILDPEVMLLYRKTFFAIADATHNFIYAHFMKSVWGLVEVAPPYTRHALVEVPKVSDKLFRQYRRILEALAERDAKQARKVLSQHISFLTIRLKRLLSAISEMAGAERESPESKQREPQETLGRVAAAEGGLEKQPDGLSGTADPKREGDAGKEGDAQGPSDGQPLSLGSGRGPE